MEIEPKNPEFSDRLKPYWEDLASHAGFSEAHEKVKNYAFLTHVTDQILPEFPGNPDLQKNYVLNRFLENHPDFDVETYALDLQYAAKFPADIPDDEVLTSEDSEFNRSLYRITSELAEPLMHKSDDIAGRREYLTVKKILLGIDFAEQYPDGADVQLRKILDDVWTIPNQIAAHKTARDMELLLKRCSGMTTQELGWFTDVEYENTEEFEENLAYHFEHDFTEVVDIGDLSDLMLEYARLTAQEAWFAERIARSGNYQNEKLNLMHGYHKQLKSDWLQSANIVCVGMEPQQILEEIGRATAARALDVFCMVRETAEVVLEIDMQVPEALQAKAAECDDGFPKIEPEEDSNAEQGQENRNPIAILAEMALLERWALDDAVAFSAEDAADAMYGSAVVDDGNIITKSSIDMFEDYLGKTIVNFEEKLRDYEPGFSLSLPLTLQLDQMLAAASAYEQFEGDAFWALRLIDDVYSEKSNLQVGRLTRRELGGLFIDKFGRNPAEMYIMYEYFEGELSYQKLGQMTAAIDQYFPADMDVNDMVTYLESKLKIACIGAMQEWDERWDIEPEATANCALLDAHFIKDAVSSVAELNRKYKLGGREKLGRMIEKYLNIFTEEILSKLESKAYTDDTDPE